ncbi:MAG: hypothetical protein KDA80_21045 [Planctomycetaceae bacterium]|nr:hypothetical protein [Planctomycetaceae bacterium]
MQNTFERLEAILLRCWILGLLAMFVWLGAIWGLGGVLLPVHSQMFGLTRHELDVIMYCWMGLWKMGVILGFFVPWLSIRMTKHLETRSVSADGISEIETA